MNQLESGANSARSDDIRRVKVELANWLNIDYRAEIGNGVLFDPKTRVGRGLQNDITGELLCPLALNWQDLSVRTAIRNGTIDYAINNDMFLNALYPRKYWGMEDDEDSEAEDSQEGFLRNPLLVKCFFTVFTSPSSVDDLEDDEVEGPVPKKQKSDSGSKKATKRCVADLVNLEEVTSRALAYVATLYVFNLTNAVQWPSNGIYNGFDFSAFYNFLIDYIDIDVDEDSAKNRKSLFEWWNQRVFPDRVASKTNSDEAWKSFLARRARRKAARQAARRDLRRYPGHRATPIEFEDTVPQASTSNMAGAAGN